MPKYQLTLKRLCLNILLLNPLSYFLNAGCYKTVIASFQTSTIEFS